MCAFLGCIHVKSINYTVLVSFGHSLDLFVIKSGRGILPCLLQRDVNLIGLCDCEDEGTDGCGGGATRGGGGDKYNGTLSLNTSSESFDVGASSIERAVMQTEYGVGITNDTATVCKN